MSEKIYNSNVGLAFVTVIRVCIQTFSALLLGIFIASSWLANEIWFKKILEEKIQTTISDMVKLPVVCKIKDINLLSSRITCSDLLCVDKDWKFESSDFVFKFSWLSFFLKSKVEAELIFYETKAYTIIKEDNSLPLFSALKAIFNAPTVLPIFFNNYSLKQCTLNIKDLSNTTNITLLFSIDTLIHNAGIKNIITVSDGVINYKDKDIFQHIKSNLIINLKDQNLLDSTSFYFNFDIPLLKEYGNQFNLTGNYQDNSGNIYISNATQNIFAQIDNLKNNIDSQSNSICASVKANFPIIIANELIKRLINPEGNFKSILENNGTCQAQAEVIYKNNKISYDGLLSIKDIITNVITLNKLDFIFSGIDLDMRGKVEGITSRGNFEGNWQYQNKLNTEITNTNQIALTKNLKIVEKKLKTNFLIDQDFNIKLYYNCEIQDYNKSYNILGEINKKNSLININGLLSSINNNESLNATLISTGQTNKIGARNFKYYYDCLLELMEKDSIFNLKSIKINDAVNNLCTLNYDLKTKSLKGELNDILIKDLIANSIGYEIKGNSKVFLSLSPTHLNKKLFSNISFEVKDSNIRLPYIYNNLNSVNGEINLDIDQNRLFINNLKVKLHKGLLNTSQATIQYNLNNYSIDYIHLPIIISDCLLSWKKDFFGVLTGRIAIINNFNNINKIEGQLILENSYLHNNLLSGQAQKDILKNTLNSLNKSKEDMQLNIELITYEPIKVKTKFLDTSACVRAIAKGTFQNPEISGLIDLQGGFLAFPHKPLYISSGKIFLNNYNDPTIELVAKNTIDKHIITLHATGSISNPEIYFESMPNLPDEQIMTLLFAGTKDGSLYSLMPAVIMTALQDLLFGTKDFGSKSFGAKTFSENETLKDLLEPLKDIKIVPSLSNGQGKGIKAGVGITFKDKLKAFVQNNINMSEETQVKVEYALSDDINICGVKDDQGNVSGEVEMRWKF